MRIEDVDEPRSRADAAPHILATLASYGFAHDASVVHQSRRTSLYEDALEALCARGLAYECACTRRELESAPMSASGERVYPGTCRDGIPLVHRSRKQRAWRVRVDDETIAFVDRLQGPQRQRLAGDVGDFVVRRADGLFAYQLAVVVDDALQSITDVVRGADLLSSTPRQRFLQRALGFPEPRYLHVPIAVATTGEKLSKQTRARPLPDSPLPVLLAAWRFLQQPMPETDLHDVAGFWSHAIASWSVARLPPVTMLPAPAPYAS